MTDWVDYYIDNEGFDSSNRAFGFTSRKIESGEADYFKRLLKEVIKRCSEKEKELNRDSFRKLAIRIVNEYCFNTIEKMAAKKDSKYEYIILISKPGKEERNEALVKHKIAHEIAHFFFALQERKFDNKSEEEKECHKKTDEWGFPDPEEGGQ